MCDLNKTWVLSLPWCKESPTGLSIDIFPIDGIEVNQNQEEYKLLNRIFKKELLARSPMTNFARPMPFSRRWRSLIMKAAFFLTDIRKKVTEYEAIISKTDWGGTKLCGNKSILVYHEKERFPTSLFESYTNVCFEDFVFKSIKVMINICEQYMETICNCRQKINV